MKILKVKCLAPIRLEDGHVIYDGDASAPEAVVTPNLAGRGAAG